MPSLFLTLVRNYLWMQFIGCIVSCLSVFWLGSWAQAQDYVPGELIVKLKTPAGSEAAFAFMGKAHSEKEMTLRGAYGKLNIYHFGLKKGQKVEDAVAELRQDPNVEYVEPNYILRKVQQPGAIQALTEAEMQQVAQADALWSSGGVDIGLQQFYQAQQSVSAQAAAKPIIAVIDTGLDLNHPVFTDTSAVWTNTDEIAANGVDDDGNGYVDDLHGWNFVDNTASIYDDDGHGTHVSGIILNVDQDITANPRHAARIAIMPLKFLDGNGVGSTSNAIRAIYYAAQNGAVVLNNSWGGPSYSGALHEAMAYAYNQGLSIIAAAGNSSGNNDSAPMYPASLDIPSLISVAAITGASQLASFSNYGRNTVHLGSPGVMIYSTLPGGWGSASGTSMAAPYVAGVAIQMKVESPGMLGYQIRSIIFNQATPTSNLVGKVYTEGKLDAADSINYAQSASVDSAQPAYFGAYSQNRELASSISGGGCGMVHKLYQSSRDRFGDGPPTQGLQTWYVLLVVALLAAPLIISQYLRRQAPENRRRYERFRFNSEVTVQIGDRELIGSVSSISLGGVQLNTEAMLEKGGMVKMQISSPDGKESIAVEGKVVWSEARKAYGVAFNNAPHTALYRISQWTKSLQRTG